MPSWEAAESEELLGRWAMNLMLINVSTRRFGRTVRLPTDDILATAGAGTSKSAVSRRFVALSAAQMKEWMAADLSQLDPLVIQIDGIDIENDLVLLAAVGIDGDGEKHPVGVLEGAAENAAVVQALLDHLVDRGGWTRRCVVCSSLTGRRHCGMRSAGCSASIRQYSSTCMLRCGGRCARRGSWMTLRRRGS